MESHGGEGLCLAKGRQERKAGDGTGADLKEVRAWTIWLWGKRFPDRGQTARAKSVRGKYA